MEKITKEEFYKTAKKSRRIKTVLMEEIDKLELDEGFKITKKEFEENYSTSPNGIYVVLQHFRQDRSNKKFTTHTLRDKSGWYVLRIK